MRNEGWLTSIILYYILLYYSLLHEKRYNRRSKKTINGNGVSLELTARRITETAAEGERDRANGSTFHQFFATWRLEALQERKQRYYEPLEVIIHHIPIFRCIDHIDE